MNLLLLTVVLVGADPRDVGSLNVSRRPIDDRLVITGTLTQPSVAVIFAYAPPTATAFGAALPDSKGNFAGAWLTIQKGPALAIPVEMNGSLLMFGPPKPFTIP